MTPPISLSGDTSRMQIDVIHRFLSEESYWAQGIPRETVEESIQHSLCFGAFQGSAQVGFARVVTDRATYAYICDVFVLPTHRGRGLSKKLVEEVNAHPDLQGLRRWGLVTQDAHGLYSRFGFQAPTTAAHLERRDPEVYTRSANRRGNPLQAAHVLSERAG